MDRPPAEQPSCPLRAPWHSLVWGTPSLAPGSTQPQAPTEGASTEQATVAGGQSPAPRDAKSPPIKNMLEHLKDGRDVLGAWPPSALAVLFALDLHRSTEWLV